MAKIKHNNFLDSVDRVISNAKHEGVVHLYADNHALHGRKISIDKKELLHFGTTGYLGLEQDIRLKEAAVAAIYNLGTQFPLSKTYIAHPLYATLEEKLFRMYRHPVIITKNSTLGHIAVIPTIVRDEDAVILDHQVHWSVQNATAILKTRGIPVEMIRHNNMDMLEDKIRELGNKVRNIWYMADGVYSMFGDFAPVSQIKYLMDKYPQLRLYFDDVHGMSWKGKHGTGFITNQFQILTERIIVIATLSKTFGASGSMVICPDKNLYHKIKNFGGPLTFSAQLEPASVAAAIASADIHLSDEIYTLQTALQKKIAYFNQCLDKTDLPLVDQNESPVFYIGTGMPATGYNFVKRLMNDGFFVNLGLFPAVPVKNTGVRITVSIHNLQEDIKNLTDAMEYHFPKALEETHTSANKVRRLFKMNPKQQEKTVSQTGNIQLRYFRDISEIDPNLWDKYLGHNNCCNWEAILFLQKAFANNERKEDNWEFHFFIASDQNNMTVLLTFFTTALWKDDLLAKQNVSEQIEQKRKTDPYYATQYVTAMGSLFTEGKHHHTNREHPHWQEAWRTVLNTIDEINASRRISQTVLRDFDETDKTLNDFLQQLGFVIAEMPEACLIPEIPWNNEAGFLKNLSPRSQRHFKKDVQPFLNETSVVVKHVLNDNELKKCYCLFQNVKERNLAINTFMYPEKLFELMNKDDRWEFILLYNKEQEIVENNPIGVMFCYKNPNKIYVPSLVGMDYDYNRKYNTYRLLLFHTIMRATALEFNSIDFGVSATFEKKKMGASVIPLLAFMQAEDNFSLERIDTSY